MENILNISPLVLKILAQRGVDSDEKLSKFISPSDQDFYDPYMLSGMEALAYRVRRAMQNREKILIFGDYDVDGVSATAVLCKYFESQDYPVDYYLPNRYVDGYGLTNDVLLKIQKEYNPSLIITVDCGISCYKEVEFAKTLGIEVCITDHHEIPEVIPKTIVVDPKLPGQEYPCSFLCGTGVAFKLVQALTDIEEAKKYLGIVAIATIADIVPLRDENRAIVKLGMENFEQNLPLGIKMLFSKCNMDERAQSTDIAFKIAPKINAAGRMGDASVALDIYMQKDRNVLNATIAKLLDLNSQRQELCNKVYDDAIARLGKINICNYNSIVLYSKEWDSGILGIVAAKIANEFNRPTVLFSEIDDELKGSARSVNSIDIFSAISSMKEVLVAFGGHKMAAGLTIKKKDFTSFINSLNKYLDKNYSSQDFLPEESYDLEINTDEITDKFVQDLKILEPTGCENPRPIFKTTLDERASISAMTGHPRHLNITSGNLTFLAFNDYKYLPILRTSTDREITFELQESEFRNKKYLRGIVSSFLKCKLSMPRTDIIFGEYIKQLSYTSSFKSRVQVYSQAKLPELIKEAAKDHFGTLFVCFEPSSYKKLLEDKGDMPLLEQIYEVIPNSGINAVLLSPSSFENLGSYRKIIMLDSPLCKEYLSKMSENTPATIFVPKEDNFSKAIFQGLKFDRETFGLYYKAFCRIAQTKLPLASDTMLFREMYQINKAFSFRQFIFCLGVFEELGLIKREEEDGFYILVEVKGKNRPLNESDFYNKVSLMARTTKGDK